LRNTVFKKLIMKGLRNEGGVIIVNLNRMALHHGKLRRRVENMEWYKRMCHC